MISCAGREVRLKDVAQEIPTFSMSCFKLTKKVCKGLVSYMSKYWWSSSIDKRSLHWISWKELTKPKCQVGMGCRDLHMFNLALLGKHGWRFLTNPTSLCARVMKGRYFLDPDFLHASATWRAIISGRESLVEGIDQRVGDGTSINPWTNKWIPTTLTRTPLFKPLDTSIT